MAKSTNEQTLLTVGEAAKVVGVAVVTIRRWEAAGLIQSVRTPGGHRRFKREDVERLVSVR